MSKKLYLTILACLLFLTGQAQMKNVIVQHGSSMARYENIDSAFAHAVSGDDIYLSGGTFQMATPINKSLNIYGAGYSVDSTLATLPTVIMSSSPSLISGAAASNSMITGVQFTAPVSISGASNIMIKRCQVTQFGLTLTNVSNVSISECILTAINAASTAANVEVKNSILFGIVGVQNGLVEHCVLFNPLGTITYNPSQGSSNTTFRNNIFYLSGPTSNTNSTNTYINNVFTDTVYNSIAGIFSNNIFNKPLSGLFRNVAFANSYSSTMDFHLKPASAAIGAGTGGTDAGIYGGANPFKEGGVPANPHIQKFTVPAATDQGGNLNINFSVGAQNN